MTADVREAVAAGHPPEVLKFARLVGRAPEDVAVLADVPEQEARAYREAVTELLFDDAAGRLRPAAAAAPLLPTKVLAIIAEKALGPLVCARLASLVDGRRAADVAGHLDPPFLAEVAAELDPRRVAQVLRGIPTDTLVAAALELARAGEHVPMGRFVGSLDEAPLAACVEALSDEDLMRTGYVLEDMERLDAIFELVGDDRARRLLRDAREQGLDAEADVLVGHLDAARRARLLAEDDAPTATTEPA